MSDLNENLRKKAFGIIKSIETMNTKEKQGLPSEAYGKNYMSLRALCLKNNPDIEELLPPEVTFDDYTSGRLTSNSYSEIHSFCNEIYHLLE